MYGLFAVIKITEYDKNSLNKQLPLIIPLSDEADEVNFPRGYLAYCDNGKFQSDKVFFCDDSNIVCFDGVILNKGELLAKHDADSLEVLFKKCVSEKSLSQLLHEMRGSFSGLIIIERNVFFFCDHLSTKPLFYMITNGCLIVSSEVATIAHYLKDNDINYSLDLVGAYSLASYAFMLGNHTLIEGVKRLENGTIACLKNGVLSFSQYYQIEISPCPISESEALDGVNYYFSRAVNLQLKKNEEMNYLDVIPLSAGCDCRMTAFVARSLSDRDMLNFSYSEFYQDDCMLPGLMARELKNKWIFKSLDNGLDMLNIQDSIKIADGLIYYLWPAQLNDFMKIVNTENWGIVHTGVIGDAILGTLAKSQEQFESYYHIGDGAYSQLLIPKLLQVLSQSESNPSVRYEKGMILNRGINGACMGYSKTFRRYCQDMSPFMDVDFLNFCFSLPYEYRLNHSLYYKWIMQYYPNAAKYKHNGLRISNAPIVSVAGKKVRIDTIPNRLSMKFKSVLTQSGYGINPFQAWYNNNEQIRKVLRLYFKASIEVTDLWPELRNDIYRLFEKGTVIEKCLAISLLGSIRLFFE